jgi:ubiquinone/menaquinone biosynthesis C-methylase UbiE
MNSIHHDNRRRKSEKIIAILQDYLRGQEKYMNCLDVGCSSGIISNDLAQYFNSVVAIDVDIKLPTGDDGLPSSNNRALFAQGNGQELPFPENSFDVVVCAQVYEHVNDQQALASEIYRVIRQNGICFFSGPNRLAIIEEHYWLPFLSWLPHSLASFYMRVFNRGAIYDAHPLFFWQLVRLWKNFKIIDYTLHLLRKPEKFSVSERVEKFSWIRIIPDVILKALKPLYPNYNWILVKKHGKKY